MALFEPIFEALNAAGVRYVVVGGVAVVLHGHVRLTADLDLAVDLDPQAARHAIAVFTDLGLQPRIPVAAETFADPELRERLRLHRNMEVFSMVDPRDPLRSVDLFVHEPIPFDELYARSAEVDLGDLPVRVASIADLIDLKQAAGRPQDLADIEALRAIGDA